MYSILQNKDKELMLIIDAQDSTPDDPLFIYDGTDKALLFRDWDSTLRLNNLSLESVQALEENSDILVIEQSADNIVRDYMARIRKVRDVKSMVA